MAKYISAEIAKKALADSNLIPRYAESCKPITDRIIDSLTAADVEPVRHGEWQLVRRMAACGEYECSVCGRIETFGCFNKPENNPYCHCGAKMDLEAK